MDLPGVWRHQSRVPDVLGTLGDCQTRSLVHRSARLHRTSIACPQARLQTSSRTPRKTNVTGKIKTSSGTTSYSANSLVAPLEGTSSYVSVIWNYPAAALADTALILTFWHRQWFEDCQGGWDNVHGPGCAERAGLR